MSLYYANLFCSLTIIGVIACFNEGQIDLNIGLKLDLGWIFTLINIVKATDESGWLETTYLTEKVRIGR